MAQLLMLVTDRIDLCSEILEAWERAGVPGATLIDSSGSRYQYDETRDDLPFVVSLRSLMEAERKETSTLFSVIEDDEVIERAIAAVHELIPELVQGHRGILFTLPVTRVWGMYPVRTQKT